MRMYYSKPLNLTLTHRFKVFNILSSWRGTLKKLAMPVVMREYQKQIHSQEDPNEIIDNQEGACDLIRKNVKALLEKHSFHFGPRDAQVSHIFFYYLLTL